MKQVKLMAVSPIITITLLVLFLFATGCQDKGGYQGSAPVIYCDASKPVVFEDFSPKEGLVRTSMFIEGSNFGTDVSKITVTVGGISAPVIGSSGSRIYLMVPRRSNEGTVKVTIRDNQNFVKEYEFEERFHLNTTLQVATLAGKVDPQTNASSIIDGTFEELNLTIHGGWNLIKMKREISLYI